MKNKTNEIEEKKLDVFLEEHKITKDEFEKASILWEDLLKIREAHIDQIPSLTNTAGMLATVLQQGPDVHSVRWRIKDPDHLIAKIIRKRIESSDKYADITVDNYSSKVTDLIGVRVLHLFKQDWLTIHQFIDSNWEFEEDPVAYIRGGDDSENKTYAQNKCIVKTHDAGYRSVHYIISTRPLKDKIFTEIQVRTLFEEGWSEIDHKIRYPNFLSNDLINYFLKIFNRLSGSADEMGSFVLDLRQAADLMEVTVNYNKIIEKENQESIEKVNKLIVLLENEQQRSGNQSKELTDLRSEIDKLKNNNEIVIGKAFLPYDPSLYMTSHVKNVLKMASQANAGYYSLMGDLNKEMIADLNNSMATRFSDLSKIQSTEFLSRLSNSLNGLYLSGIPKVEGVKKSTATHKKGKSEKKSNDDEL